MTVYFSFCLVDNTSNSGGCGRGSGGGSNDDDNYNNGDEYNHNYQHTTLHYTTLHYTTLYLPNNDNDEKHFNVVLTIANRLYRCVCVTIISSISGDKINGDDDDILFCKILSLNFSCNIAIGT